MSSEDENQEVVSAILLAGVFLEPLTGRKMLRSAPGVNPILEFLEALMQVENVRQRPSPIVKANGPLPPPRKA